MKLALQRWAVCGVILLSLDFRAAGGAAPRRLQGRGIDGLQYLSDVRYLASDELKGRGTGTPELDKAAHFLALEFRKAGLMPVNGKSYLQPFEVSLNPAMSGENHFVLHAGNEAKTLALRTDFVPLNFSGTGRVAGQAVFAGYGITAAEYGYDDYAGVDARGKLVVVLKHEPQEYDSRSPFEGRVYTEHSQLASKAANARRHGARALILISDTFNHSGSDALDGFVPYTAPGGAGIPCVQAKAEALEAWFRASGRDARELQEAIDRDLRPRSFEFPEWVSAEIEAQVIHEQRVVSNVAAYLPGETSEYLIIGAHYDHLGLGEQFSMASGGAGKPHPGADDNASGAAGLLALARWFADQPRMRRGVLFLAFAGEELGLLGSGHYVRHPLLPPAAAVAMINLDMIGRVRDSTVIIGGAKTGSTFARVLEEAQRRTELKLDTGDQAVYGSSDHTSFLTWRLPVLFFFSGLHPDYHRPSDTWDRIEWQSTAKLLEVVADAGSRLANDAERPGFLIRVNIPQ